MNNILLFLLVCIPLRILLTILAYKLDPSYLPVLGIVLFVFGISMVVLYFGNYRLNVPEANGDTWWHKFRLLHGMLYITASMYAFQGDTRSWIPLAIDTVFGLVLFIDHHAYPI